MPPIERHTDQVSELLAQALALLILAGAPLIAVAAEPGKTEALWYSIVAADGSVIGLASQETTAAAGGKQIVQTQEILLADEAGSRTRATERSVVRQDATGQVVSIISTSRSGSRRSRSEAKVTAGKVEVVEEGPGGRHTYTLNVSPAVRFDGGTELVKVWDPAATSRLEFEQFNIDAAKVERVVMEAAPAAASDPAGLVPVVRRRYDGQALIGVARLLLEKGQGVAAVTQPMFGSSVTIRLVDQKTALAPHRPYRVLNHVMTPSPFRISDAAAKGHIRYRFTFRDGMTFSPSQTGEQRVTAQADGAIVDICGGCGPGLGTDEAALADALKPTAWLQSAHPRLKALASRTPAGASDARKMELLTEEGRSRLRTIDFTGHYSALETLNRGAGDCTEAAVLLAALGRAAGIPTRVVNGLVYSRERYHGVGHVFMPHSWVLAYVDGKWRSYDSALEGFDATHIALTIGDGDERSIAAAGQLASLLVWQGMSEVRTRPEN